MYSLVVVVVVVIVVVISDLLTNSTFFSFYYSRTVWVYIWCVACSSYSDWSSFIPQASCISYTAGSSLQELGCLRCGDQGTTEGSAYMNLSVCILVISNQCVFIIRQFLAVSTYYI